MVAPASAETIYIDVDPEEEEEERSCDPHCMPLSSSGFGDEVTVVVDTPVGEVSVTQTTDGPVPDLLPFDDPEEEEEKRGCRPHCMD